MNQDIKTQLETQTKELQEVPESKDAHEIEELKDNVEVIKDTIIPKALINATEQSKGKVRVGALVLDKKGTIISKGCNSYTKTHPQQALAAFTVGKPKQIFLHAEIDTLVRCREDPHTILVCRLRPNGQVALAKPCSVCMSAIEKSGCKIVYYTTDDGDFENIEIGD
jgi:tRNA(Arg) A34 adenosine deaminase TadA